MHITEDMERGRERLCHISELAYYYCWPWQDTALADAGLLAVYARLAHTYRQRQMFRRVEA